MPSKSDKQLTAARIARAVQKGEVKAKPGSASAQMAKMPAKSLKHFLHKEEKSYPSVMFGDGFKKS